MATYVPPIVSIELLLMTISIYSPEGQYTKQGYTLQFGTNVRTH